MKTSQLKWMFVLFLTAILSAPAWASDAITRPAVPGTLNYVEGKVSIGAESVDTKAIGTAQLEAGQSLTTQKGKAEILLTPGVFLRVGDNSSVKMVSTSLTDTEVALENGHAMIEVAEIHPENDIRIAADGKTTQLLKTGLYDFDASEGEVRVFEGKARVEESNRHVDLKGGRELSLENQDNLKPAKFDKKSYDDGDLYKWSSLRSAYIAEANVDAAGLYAQSGWGPWGPGWWGAGWYWDPWFDGFTFIPGDGIFYSPFGWGFYSPWYVYDAPFYGYGGYRYGGGRYVHHFSGDYRNWGAGSHYVGDAHYSRGVYTGAGSAGGGFHSSGRVSGGARPAGGSGGGGFSGGGFHGGGFGGGGMHGGGSHGR